MPVCKQRWRDLALSVHAGRRRCSWELTSRIGTAPEDDCPVFVRRICEDLVQLDSKAVQVANVQRAKVAVEGVVQQCLVDTEVDGRLLGPGRGRTYLGA